MNKKTTKKIGWELREWKMFAGGNNSYTRSIAYNNLKTFQVFLIKTIHHQTLKLQTAQRNLILSDLPLLKNQVCCFQLDVDYNVDYLLSEI